MQPITKLYLKTFLFTGLPFGLLMLGFDLSAGQGFNLGEFLFWTFFFGASMALILVSLHKTRLKKSGIREITTENLGVNQPPNLKSGLNKAELIKKRNDMKALYTSGLILCLALGASAQQGVVTGDCTNGTGTFNYDEKGETSYSGQWVNNMRQGTGKMTYARRINESNLPAGPEAEESKGLPLHLVEEKDKLLLDIKLFGTGMFVYDEDQKIAMAESIGAYYGYNQKSNPAGAQLRSLYEQSLSHVKGLDYNIRYDHEFRIKLNYVKALLNENVAEGVALMTKQHSATSNFIDAGLMQAESEDIMEKGYYKLASDVGGFIPVVGEVLDVWKITTGVDLDGSTISITDRTLGLVGLLIPNAMEELVRGAPNLMKAMKATGNKMLDMAPGFSKTMAKNLAEQYPEALKRSAEFSKKMASQVAESDKLKLAHNFTMEYFGDINEVIGTNLKSASIVLNDPEGTQAAINYRIATENAEARADAKANFEKYMNALAIADPENKGLYEYHIKEFDRTFDQELENMSLEKESSAYL